MDSVDLINAGQPADMSKDHLEIMVAKDYWTTEDLTPLTAAIAA